MVGFLPLNPGQILTHIFHIHVWKLNDITAQNESNFDNMCVIIQWHSNMHMWITDTHEVTKMAAQLMFVSACLGYQSCFPYHQDKLCCLLSKMGRKYPITPMSERSAGFLTTCILKRPMQEGCSANSENMFTIKLPFKVWCTEWKITDSNVFYLFLCIFLIR